MSLEQVLPWDWDMDTQISSSTLMQLASHHNQTIISYRSSPLSPKRRYLLDVNPWCHERDHFEGLNVIDARWIDIQNGLYIDITALRELSPEIEPNVWECKNFHRYNAEDIYPLRRTMFEGVRGAKVPLKYASILADEYTRYALTETTFNK